MPVSCLEIGTLWLVAAAVALVAEVLALAPMAVVSAAEGLEELAVLVASMVLRLGVSSESEAVSAGRRAAELEQLVAQWLLELGLVQRRCPFRWHLGPRCGPRPRYQPRRYPGPPLLLLRTPAEVRCWIPE